MVLTSLRAKAELALTVVNVDFVFPVPGLAKYEIMLA
jgi:hypothetical protein